MTTEVAKHFTVGANSRLSCRICGATVEVDQTELHARWHLALRSALARLFGQSGLEETYEKL
jgi:hypothetical protein